MSMTLPFTHGDRVMRKQELVSHSGLKLHEVVQIFAVVDRVREMDSKKTCKYSKMDHMIICSSCLALFSMLYSCVYFSEIKVSRKDMVPVCLFLFKAMRHARKTCTETVTQT